MGWTVERDLRKVLGVRTEDEVVARMNAANLTVRQRRCLEEYYGVVVRRRETKETAEAEGITPSAVNVYRMEGLRKLGVRSRMQIQGRWVEGAQYTPLQ